MLLPLLLAISQRDAPLAHITVPKTNILSFRAWMAWVPHQTVTAFTSPCLKHPLGQWQSRPSSIRAVLSSCRTASTTSLLPHSPTLACPVGPRSSSVLISSLAKLSLLMAQPAPQVPSPFRSRSILARRKLSPQAATISPDRILYFFEQPKP